MAVNGGRINFQVGYNVDTSGLQKGEQAVRQSLNSLMAEAKKPGNALNESMQKALQSAQQLESAYNKAFNTNLGSLNVSTLNKELENSGTNLKTIQKDFLNAGSSGQVAWARIGSQILGTNVQLRNTNTLLDRMAQTMAGTVKWGITSRIFNNIANSISDSFHYVKELDSSLNDIRIVTDKSADSMKDFAKQANEAAKALGASTRDYTEASLIYFQQGLGDTETAARAETTLKAANVTGQNADEVSEQLTAVWNGYKVSADEAELYVDKLAAVAATTAADLEELSTGMSKVASAANLMGVDIDQLNAQLATIVSVTRQAPESVGTALKTIYARMGDIKAGLDTETTLGEYTSQMAAMGINVLDANKELRDMGEVIEEIGGKWASMSREQQISLSQTMAGTRQYNNLLSLFDNWDMYTEAMQTSADAAGTLNKQNEIYLESTEAKLQELRTTMEGVYGELLDTDTINTLVDAMTDLAQVAENFIGSFGGGLKSISMVAIMIANIFNKQLSRGITGLIQKQQIYNQNVNELQQKINFINLGMSQGYEKNNVYGQAALHGYESQLKIAEKIVAVRASMTNEEYHYLTTLQQEIGALEEQSSLIELQTRKQAEKILNGDSQQANNLMNIAFKGSDVEIENKRIELENNINIEQEKLDIAKQNLAISEDINIKEANRYENAKKVLRTDENLLKNGQRRTAEQKKAVQEANKILNSMSKQEKLSYENYNARKKAVQEAEEEYQIAEKILKIFNQAVDAAARKNEIDKRSLELQRSITTATDLAAKGQQVQKVFTGITSSISSTAMAWSSMSSLVDTVFDEEIEFGDKLLQIIMTLSFSLPMLTSSFHKLTEALGFQGTVLTSLSAARAAHTASVKMENLVSQEHQAAILQELAARELNVASMTKEQMLEAASTIVKETNIGLTEAETLAVMEATVAQNAWNASLLANPVVLVVMALVALVAGIAAVITWQDKMKEKRIEEYTATLEELDAKKQEIETNQELINSYQELYKTYEKSREGLDSVRTKQEELIKSLKNGEERLGGLKNNLKLFNAELQKIELETIEDSVNTALDGLETSKKLTKENYTDKEVIMTLEEFTKPYDKNTETDATKILEEMGFAKNNILFPEFQDIIANEHVSASELNMIYQDFQKIYKEFKEQGISEEDSLFKFVESSLEEFGEDEGFQSYLKQVSDAEIALSNQFLLKTDQTAVQDEESFEEFRKNFIEKLSQNIDIKRSAEAAEDEDAYWDNLLKQASAKYGTEDFTKQLELETERNAFTKAYKGYAATEMAAETLGLSEEEVDTQLEKLAQYVQDKGLSSIFTGAELTTEDWTAFFNADGSQEAIEELILKNRDKLRESFAENQAGIVNDLSVSLFEEAQSGDLTIENIADNENWQSLKGPLETIKQLYPELRGEVETLNNTAIVGSQEWTTALGEVQDAMSQLSLSDKAREIDDAVEDIDITLDTKDFEKELNEALDLKTKLVVEVRAETTQEFNEMVNGMNSLTDAASKIGDDFKVSTEDIYALGQAFPDIYKNAEYLADGTIKLNSDVAKSSMAAAQAEITDDYNKTITKLKNKKRDVDANIALYQGLVKIAQEASNDESKIDAAKADIKDGLNREIQISDINKTDVELKNIDAVSQSEVSMYETSVKNANEAWKKKVEMSKVANEAIRQNALYGEGLAESKVDYSYEVDYQGEVADISETAEVTEDQIDTAKTTEDMKNITSGLNQYLAALENYSDELGIEIAAADAEFIQSLYQLKGAGTGKGTDNKKDGSDKDKEIIDKLEDERDIYLEINQQLEAMEAHMSSLETANEKLFGQSKVDNYKKQIENLDKQIELSQKRMEISAEEVAKYQKALEKDGLTFDKEGMLTNYDEWYNSERKEINKLIKEYNKLSAKEQETKKGQKLKNKIDTRQSEFEESQDWIDTYLDSYQQFMDDENAIAEAEAEKVSKYIESLDYEIQLKVDDSELQNAYEDFKQNMMSEEDFSERSSSLARQYQNIVDSGQIEARNAQIKEVKKAIQTIEQGGVDENFGTDLAQAREHLQTLIQDQISDYEALQEISVSIAENWGDSLDAMGEDMEDVQKKFDNLSSEVEHYSNLTKLIFGDEDYTKQKEFFQNQDDINRARLSTLQQNLDVWKAQREKTDALYQQALKNGNKAMADSYKETLDSLDENIQEATESIQSTLEETVENIIAEFENAINSVVQEAETALSGGLGFDIISDGLSKAKQYSDDWLDDVQRIYETNKLIRQFDDAAAAASTASAQQKILAAKQKELAILEKQDKLSQYDLDRANAQYNLTLKQIALEEAQQNKSKMVLKRDAQGNYSYQYTADSEEVSKAQQEVEDAQFKVNELDQDRYFQLAQGLTELNQNMLEEMAQANIDYANDEAKRQQALVQIEDYYNKEKANLKEDLGIVEEHLMDSSFTYFKSLYDIDALNWKSMTDTEKETYKTFIFGEEGLVPIATSGFDQIKATLTGEEDSFDTIFTKALDSCNIALDTYKTKVSQVAQDVGGSFNKIVNGGEESVGLVDTATETDKLKVENEKLVESYTGEEGVLTTVEAVCIEFGKQEQAHKDVKKAMDKQIKSGTKLLKDMQGIGEEADNVKKKMDALKKSIEDIPSHKKITIEYSTSGNSGNDSGSAQSLGTNEELTPSTLPEVKIVRLLDYNTFKLKKEIGKPSLWKFYPRTPNKDKQSDGEKDGKKYKHINTAQRFNKDGELVEIVHNTWMDFDTWKKLKGFDTGGYTGSWNSSEGKMAMLHEKELVLNKQDTKNILSAVNSVRMIDSIINSLESSMKSRVFGLMMNSYSQAKGYTKEDKGFEQHVQISASFPDAVDHNEIEIALNNLMNRASQLAWKDNR